MQNQEGMYYCISLINKYLNLVLVIIGKRPERWKECLQVIENEDWISIGSLYVRKYFNQTNKSALSEIVSDVKQGLKKILQKVSDHILF